MLFHAIIYMYIHINTNICVSSLITFEFCCVCLLHADKPLPQRTSLLTSQISDNSSDTVEDDKGSINSDQRFFAASGSAAMCSCTSCCALL